ncbi:MAG: glycosyltransferase [Oscillospiraceae bacterium]|nr:glycosyltransferase [Oscillospiraceae bacterium]
MKFSVIIPVYHSYKYIERCLDSLLAQTVADDFEILCCGDRVEDPTHAIIERYAQKYPGKVQLHLQEGRGPSGARNLGLSLAKGEYIMFADADDYVEPGILEDCERALLAAKADFVCVAFERIDVTGKKFSKDQKVREITIVDVTPENVTKMAFIFTAPWGKMFKRGFLSGCTFPEHPVSVYEDCIFMLSVYPKVKRYIMLPTVLYHYLVHEEQGIQTSASVEKATKFRNDLVDLKKKFEAEGISEPYMKMLDIAAFIHVGIADVHRAAENPDVNIREFCKSAKSFFDENFPGWRKIKMRPYRRFTLRCKAVWIAKQMYRMNIFWIFIKCYNWMIKTLHIDVKW